MASLASARVAVAAATLSFALAGCAHAPPAPSSMIRLSVQRHTADTVLRPGDFLFRYVNPTDPLDSKVSGAIVEAGQVAVQSTVDTAKVTVGSVADLLRLHDAQLGKALTEGDPNAVHMGIYLGGGLTAEAFGTSLSDAKVGLWQLFTDGRKSTAWRVFRHKDARVAAAVADVARRWATGPRQRARCSDRWRC